MNLFSKFSCVSGNIRVFCRCRPLSKSEVVAGCASVMDFDAANDGDLGIAANGSNKKSFKFDRVYTPKDDQGGHFLLYFWVLEENIILTQYLNSYLLFST